MRTTISVKAYANNTIGFTVTNRRGERFYESRMTIDDVVAMIDAAPPGATTIEIVFHDRPRAVSIRKIREAL